MLTEEQKLKQRERLKKKYWENRDEYKLRNHLNYLKHKEGRNRINREYYWSHHDELLIKQRVWLKKYWDKLKREVMTHYGNGKYACVKCGINDPRVLSIDHIKAIGTLKRTIEDSGGNLYRKLRKQGFPSGYQTLCMNCQFVKRYENHETANQHGGFLDIQ